jgi:hypothetical protein
MIGQRRDLPNAAKPPVPNLFLIGQRGDTCSLITLECFYLLSISEPCIELGAKISATAKAANKLWRYPEHD